ncbi:hypothetical protein ROZALSC1DRAFT_25753 [Rozella allomycis CSF55]|uniref:Uncharacterized protein n=1 Tax=Rozella allomycis (strain CSF55) TaxID=988480 RepID=A0A4P9YA13_ROZAC|nr:hypothetical protein ROZALSC1DRAFT_25753 [Rozella allomycis CSF55]
MFEEQTASSKARASSSAKTMVFSTFSVLEMAAEDLICVRLKRRISSKGKVSMDNCSEHGLKPNDFLKSERQGQRRVSVDTGALDGIHSTSAGSSNGYYGETITYWDTEQPI